MFVGFLSDPEAVQSLSRASTEEEVEKGKAVRNQLGKYKNI